MVSKILFFTTNFHPYLGGLENYVLELASRLVKKGIKVDVLTYNVKGIDEYEEYKGIGIYRIPCFDIMKDVYSLPRFNTDTKRILKELAKNEYDFVITQTRFFSSSWLGMRFARKNKIKHIHTEHGNVHVRHDNKIIQSLAWLYDMTIGKKIFRTAWKVIGISKACCNFAIKMGAKPAKVVLIHNSVDTNVFKPQEKEKMGLNYSFVISYVGRLIYAKGIQDLIEALWTVQRALLLVVGKGPYIKELKKLAREKRVDVMFLGERKADEIIKYLNASDVFVNPSYSEGLPTSVLEAGACGVPVIATDVGGTREIIGEQGFLVKPHDVQALRKKIFILKRDKELRERFGKGIREKIKKEFDWDVGVDRYLKEVFGE